MNDRGSCQRLMRTRRPGLHRAPMSVAAKLNSGHCNLPTAPRIQLLDTGTFRSRRIPMFASAVVMLFSVSLWFIKQFDEPVW